MIILDTDCMSLLQRENILLGSRLQENLDRFSRDEIHTTIISFEEQMRGWLLSHEVKRSNSKFILTSGFGHS